MCEPESPTAPSSTRSIQNLADLRKLPIDKLAAEIAAGRIAAEVLDHLELRRAAAVANAVRTLRRTTLLQFLAKIIVLDLKQH